MNSEFKLNQRVWSPMYGWGIITYIYPIERLIIVKFDCSETYTFTLVGAHAFRLDGSLNKKEYPMIFHDKIDIKDWPCPKPNLGNSLKVDDPVLVSTNDIDYVRRHFAKYKDGYFYTFQNGLTKWTSSDDSLLTKWEYCKIPNE